MSPYKRKIKLEGQDMAQILQGLDDSVCGLKIGLTISLSDITIMDGRQAESIALLVLLLIETGD